MLELGTLRAIGRFAVEAVLALAPAFGHPDERIKLRIDVPAAETVLAITARAPSGGIFKSDIARVNTDTPPPFGWCMGGQMFRSVRFFRLNSAWPESEQELSERLSSSVFKPFGPYSERSTGWEAPTGDADAPLVRRVHGADLLRLRTQTRLLPAAAVDDALETRLAQWRERMAMEPSRREARKLKAQTRDELLPKAFLKSQRTQGFVIASERVVAIDTLSDARAEDFLEHLRAPLGELDVLPLAFKRPFGDLLTRVFLGDAPQGFLLGRECRMCDPSDTKASLRCTDMDLADQAVRRHLREGMRLTHLEIGFENVLTCTLDEKGGIAKLALVGADVDEDLPDENPLARLDAEIALLTGSARRLVSALAQNLGGHDDVPALPERMAVGA